MSRKFREGLPWELLFADDLALMAESKEQLLVRIERWREGMERKGLFVCLFVCFFTAHQHTRAISVPYYISCSKIINLKTNYIKLQFVKTYKTKIKKI